MAPGDSVDEEKRATLRQFAAIGAIGPLSRFVDADDPTGGSDVRRAIAGYLSKTPGAHFSKVRDDLSLGTGETQHHLRQLMDAGVVESHRDGEYRRFYPSNRFSPFEKIALGYLRRKTPRGMLIALLERPDSTGSDVAQELGVSGATVSKHVGDLSEAGLLTRENGYTVERPETLITLLVRYADSFDDRAVAFATRADEIIRFDPK